MHDDTRTTQHGTTGHGTIAVTGATGAVGGLVARGLRARGVEPRLLVRDPARLRIPADDVRVAPYGDERAVAAALEGVDTAFLVSATESADRLEQHRSFVRGAVAAGVGRIVYTSFLGAAPDAAFTLARDHARTEADIRDAGLGWTFLRDSFYADVLPAFVVDGAIRGPAGDGRVAAVARADVADAAVAALLDRAHAGRAYDLTGPVAFTLGEAAAIITEVTGEATGYVDETLEEAYRSRAEAAPDAPDWQLDAWVSTYTAIASGALDVVSADVERLTGHPPRTFADVLRDRH